MSDNENDGEGGGASTVKATGSYEGDEQEALTAQGSMSFGGDHYDGSKMEVEERGGSSSSSSSSEPEEFEDDGERQELVMENHSVEVQSTKQKKYEMVTKETTTQKGKGVVGKSENELELMDAIPDFVLKNPLFLDVKARSGTSPMISIELVTPASQRKLLIASIAEEAARKSLVRSYRGIRNVFVVDRRTEDGQSGLAFQTEGCNFNTT